MANLYIQIYDRLFKISNDITEEAICDALGYKPSSFSGNFIDLTDNPLSVVDDGELHLADESGNKILTVNKYGLHSIDFEAHGHKLSKKSDLEYVDKELQKLNDSIDVHLNGTDFDDIKNSPFKDGELGTLKIVDDDGNISTMINNKGVHSVEFEANGHQLTQKSDLSYVNDKLSSLNSSVNGLGNFHKIRVTINEANGKLTSAFVDDSNIDFEQLKNNPVVVNTKESGLFILDEDGNIGAKLDDNGLVAKNFITPEGHNLIDVTDRLETMEQLIYLDDNNVIDNLKDVIDYFANVSETESGAQLISTVATHTQNIGTLNSSIQTNKTNISSLSSKTTTISGNVSTISGNVSTISGQCATMSSDINMLNTSAHTHTNKSAIDSITQDKINKWDSIDLTGYATESFVTTQGYLKEHQDISHLAKTSDLDDIDFYSLKNNPVQDNTDGNLYFLDESGNIGMSLINGELYVANVIAGEHSLSNKVNRDELIMMIDELRRENQSLLQEINNLKEIINNL